MIQRSICQMLLCPITRDLAEKFRHWMVHQQLEVMGERGCCSYLLNPHVAR